MEERIFMKHGWKKKTFRGGGGAWGWIAVLLFVSGKDK